VKILITGICGFVGSALAETLLELLPDVSVAGIDNLMRPGSESNRRRLAQLGVALYHGDVRLSSDLDALPKADWVIDAAANPSVLAGVSGRASSRQMLEHNLSALVNVLEYAKRHGAGFLLLSSSRVYSIPALAGLPLTVNGRAFHLDDTGPLPQGVSACGINAAFSTEAPVSLYGSAKLASEIVALDFCMAFDLPVWIDRCGVLAGAGQFGTPDQGIFSYWVNAHQRRRPLAYIGFGGHGHQVRDAFHPRDLAALVVAQIRTARRSGQRVYTAGGGPANAMSLAQLTEWCDGRFGPHAPRADGALRPYDVPWVIMDNTDAHRDFGWSPACSIHQVLEGLAAHAVEHPEWLELSGI
jgi:CDP-paratose 2-epimerase